jgi:hypothetical protein
LLRINTPSITACPPIINSGFSFFVAFLATLINCLSA